MTRYADVLQPIKAFDIVDSIWNILPLYQNCQKTSPSSTIIDFCKTVINSTSLSTRARIEQGIESITYRI